MGTPVHTHAATIRGPQPHAGKARAYRAWARRCTRMPQHTRPTAARRHKRTRAYGPVRRRRRKPGPRPRAAARTRPAHRQHWRRAASSRRPAARPPAPGPAGRRRAPPRPARGAILTGPQVLLQCAAGRPRTAKPPCPSDAAPRRARDRRTAHRRRLQPRRGHAAPSPSISAPWNALSRAPAMPAVGWAEKKNWQFALCVTSLPPSLPCLSGLRLFPPAFLVPRGAKPWTISSPRRRAGRG